MRSELTLSAESVADFSIGKAPADSTPARLPAPCLTRCLHLPRAPPTVAVVSCAQAENQHKNNDEYEHFRSPLIWGYYPKVMQPI